MWLHDAECWMCSNKFIEVTPRDDCGVAKCPQCGWRLAERKESICSFTEKQLGVMLNRLKSVNNGV